MTVEEAVQQLELHSFAVRLLGGERKLVLKALSAVHPDKQGDLFSAQQITLLKELIDSGRTLDACLSTLVGQASQSSRYESELWVRQSELQECRAELQLVQNELERANAKIAQHTESAKNLSILIKTKDETIQRQVATITDSQKLNLQLQRRLKAATPRPPPTPRPSRPPPPTPAPAPVHTVAPPPPPPQERPRTVALESCTHKSVVEVPAPTSVSLVQCYNSLVAAASANPGKALVFVDFCESQDYRRRGLGYKLAATESTPGLHVGVSSQLAGSVFWWVPAATTQTPRRKRNSDASYSGPAAKRPKGVWD